MSHKELDSMTSYFGGMAMDFDRQIAEKKAEIERLRELLRLCIPSLQKDGRPHVVTMVQAALGDITADSASVVQYKPCEICTTQSWCETHGCQCYPVSAVQPERCCLDYPRCDCNSPPEPDNAPALQPCGHPWKAQHDFKCILCSSLGVTP